MIKEKTKNKEQQKIKGVMYLGFAAKFSKGKLNQSINGKLFESSIIYKVKQLYDLTSYIDNKNYLFKGNIIKNIGAEPIKSEQNLRHSKIFNNHRLKGNALENEEILYHSYVYKPIIQLEIIEEQKDIPHGKITANIVSKRRKGEKFRP